MADRTLVEIIEVITRLIGDLEAAFFRKVEEAGLTSRQLLYLDALSRLKSPALGELAAELGLSKPSVTAIADRLSAGGFAERIPSGDDGRSVRLRLTPKGRALVKMHDGLHRDIAELFEKNLTSADLRVLVEILNRATGKLK
jgi:DNA-binding MarR family transcriptional regulator